MGEQSVLPLTYAKAYRLLPGDPVLSQEDSFKVRTVAKYPENVHVTTKDGFLFGYRALFMDCDKAAELSSRLRFKGSTQDRMDSVVDRLSKHLNPYPTVTSQTMGSLLLDLDSICSDIRMLGANGEAESILELSKGLYEVASGLHAILPVLFSQKSVSSEMINEALSYGEGFAEIAFRIGFVFTEEFKGLANSRSRCRPRCIAPADLEERRQWYSQQSNHTFAQAIQARVLYTKIGAYLDAFLERDSFVDPTLQIPPLEKMEEIEFELRQMN
jgi:hypothetical protein